MDDNEEAAHKRHMERLKNMTGGGVDALWSLGASSATGNPNNNSKRSPRSHAGTMNDESGTSNNSSPRNITEEGDEEERRYREKVKQHEKLHETTPNVSDPFGIASTKKRPDARSSIANSFNDPTLSENAKRGADAYRKVALSVYGDSLNENGESSVSTASNSPSSSSPNVPGVSDDDETAFRAQQERLKALAAASSRTVANPNQLREKMMRESVKAPPGMENFHKDKEAQERMTRMAMADLGRFDCWWCVVCLRCD